MKEMRKLLSIALIIAATFAVGLAQEQGVSPQGANDNTPNMGKAPTQPNGIGRADARIFDETGQPVRNAYVKVESTRTDGFFCETWNYTNDRGVAVLPPIHMGNLKMIIKAKGFQTQKLNVPASSLNEPVRVTLVRKK